MSEAKFQKQVIEWCQELIDTGRGASHGLGPGDSRLVVEDKRLITGWQPWSKESESRRWHWEEFERQIDVVIGLKVEVTEGPNLIPLVVMELKSGASLNSDEVDKKSAVYGPLREIYPWIHSIFLHEDMAERRLGDKFLMRNGRQFDSIFTEWNEGTQALLKRQINWQLEYLLDYWEF